MRPGYVTNGLRDHRLEDALELIRDHGFTGVGLTLDVGHLDPFRTTAREVGDIADRLARLGLQAVIETGARFLLDPRHKHEPTLMTPDPAGVARRVDYLERAAAIGADLGAEVVSFFAGVDRAPGPESAGRLRDGVRRAVAAIRGRGLTPALEPEPGMAVASLADFDALAAACGEEAPALVLDIGHLYVTETDDPADLCRRYAGRARQVHVEDVRGRVHEHLEPGEGEVDFERVLGALHAGGYDGTACFELSRSSHRAPAALARCAELWARCQRAFGP